jgi:hypothetical protein
MASFGETLKRERELREITLREVSEATKINIRYLEALEANRFENLPGGLFNKGFIRAYAAYIGLDGEAMVTSYLQEVGGPGLGGTPRGTTPGMHRPQETPRRRAGPARAEPPPGLAINFPAAPAAPPVASAPAPSAAERPMFERPAADRPVVERPALERAAPEPPVLERPAEERPAAERTDFEPLDLEPSASRRSTIERPVIERSAPERVGAEPSAPLRPAAPRPMPLSAPRPQPADASSAREALLHAAIGHIQEPQPGRSGSRALLIILLFVGVAGFVFLVLSLLIPRPSPSRQETVAAAPAAVAPAPGGAAQASGGAGEAARDAASNPPEVIAAGVGNAANVGSPAGAAAGSPAKTEPRKEIAAPRGLHEIAAAAGQTNAPGPKAGAGPAGGAGPASGAKSASGAAPTSAAAPASGAGSASGPAKTGGGAKNGAAQRGGAGAMEVHIEAARESWVQMFCDGREAINWVMGKHEEHDVRCVRIVQISAADADAVRLTVNGADCASLGDKGARIHGFAIRIEDFAQICPPEGDQRNGQP